MPKDVILTPEGLANLKAELEHLSTTRRREVAARIKEAREFGDISENAEYDDAKNEQAMLEARIASLEDKLRSATVVDASDLGTDVVRVGSVVHVKDEAGKSTKYTIVGSAEAKPAEAKLSNESPVGRALLGHKRGDEVVDLDAAGRAQAEDHQDRRRRLATAGDGPWVGEPDGGRSTSLRRPRRSPAQAGALRAAGVEPFPHEFDGVEPIAAVRAAHEGLEPGEETDVSHRVAGRLAARRGQGKMAFLDLVDRSGRIQLQARVDELGAEGMERLLSLDLGDLIGVDGTAFVSRRGELTLRVNGFALLAKSLRPPPDKHHGLTDVETRFRHRELDLIANEEARELFITRARVITAIRRFLDDEGFIEVETPVLQPLYGGAMARPFTTHHNALDRELYLRIATELYLKRLIVGGLERVYEIGKNFRNEGVDTTHNPEFTCWSGTRPTPTTSTWPTAASGSCTRSPRRSATRASSISRRRGGARRWPGRSWTAPGSTSWPCASATRWRPGCARAG